VDDAGELARVVVALAVVVHRPLTFLVPVAASAVTG
jgi:hypothetical protein